jgi:hypothetical protein
MRIKYATCKATGKKMISRPNEFPNHKCLGFKATVYVGIEKEDSDRQCLELLCFKLLCFDHEGGGAVMQACHACIMFMQHSCHQAYSLPSSPKITHPGTPPPPPPTSTHYSRLGECQTFLVFL